MHQLLVQVGTAHLLHLLPLLPQQVTSLSSLSYLCQEGSYEEHWRLGRV